MKNLTILGSVLSILFAFTSCEKADNIHPVNVQSTDLLKKGGPQPATTYQGQGTSINATIWQSQNYTIVSNQYIFSQTNFLPVTGGSESVSSSQGNIQGVLTTGSLSATSVGQNDSTRSEASVENLNLTIDGNAITADLLKSYAKTSCGANQTGGSQIVNLVINETPVVISGMPNQMIYLSAGGFIILNEQSTSKKGGNKSITVSAMHLIIPNKADINLATSYANVKC